MLLARPSAATNRLAGHPRLGLLLTPRGYPEANDAPFAADNDAYAGFHPGRFRRMAERLVARPARPLWVSCPDVVADARATARRFARWSGFLRRLGLPIAFVAQDGLERRAVPWGGLDCLFLGGSTAWKLSPHAERLAGEAKHLGKLVHMGRCSTLTRIRVAARFGCDSIDSTCTARLPNLWVPKILGWLARVDRERNGPSLFAGALA